MIHAIGPGRGSSQDEQSLFNVQRSSLVVDSKGSPRTVYHGGPIGIERFNATHGPVWFAQNRAYANDYAHRRHDGMVYSARLLIARALDIAALNLNAPLDTERLGLAIALERFELDCAAQFLYEDFDAKPRMWEFVASCAFMRLAQRAGYDGIRAREGRAGITWAVFDGDQVIQIASGAAASLVHDAAR